MRDVVELRRWWRDMVVWWKWVGVGLMLPLAQKRLLPLLLLANDVDGILQLYELCPLSVDVLSVSFDALGNCLSSHNGFLFLPELLYLLLDLDQFFLLCCSFVFFSFLIPFLHLNLIKLNVAMNGLCWRKCSRG
jgi:predicted CDP-diglyceride synthetase/phosphatidate cytidylyltransferase